MATIGQRIKEFRLARGLTQEQLAEKTNKYTTQINSWETGRGVPNRTSLRILADALNVTTDELAAGAEAKSASVAEIIGKARAEISKALGIPSESCKLTLQVTF
jgi:XRE family transcriptional regulator, fatty acid utilization regulator